MKAICERCGIFTSFLWEGDDGRRVIACSAAHAPPGMVLKEFDRFEGEDYQHSTMKEVCSCEGAEDED